MKAFGTEVEGTNRIRTLLVCVHLALYYDIDGFFFSFELVSEGPCISMQETIGKYMSD